MLERESAIPSRSASSSLRCVSLIPAYPSWAKATTRRVSAGSRRCAAGPSVVAVREHGRVEVGRDEARLQPPDRAFG